MTADANFEGDSISARQTANDNCRRLAFGWEGVASSTPTRGSFATLAAELSRLRQQTARKGNGNDTRCVRHQTDARRRKAKPLWRRRRNEERGPIKLVQQSRSRDAEWAGSAAHSESEIAREKELRKTRRGETYSTHNLLLLRLMREHRPLCPCLFSSGGGGRGSIREGNACCQSFTTGRHE